MELFSYIGYDGGKTQPILKRLREWCGTEVTIKQLNERLENGIGTKWLDEAVREVDDSKKAKYLILDTGTPLMLKNMVGNNACISIVKVKNCWTAGYVGTEEELLESIRNFEANVTEAYMNQEVVNITENVGNTSTVKTNNVTPLAREIKEIMLDFGPFWSVETITKLLMCKMDMVEAEVVAHGEGSSLYWTNSMGDKVAFATGFIDDLYNNIIIIASINRSNNKVKLENYQLVTGRSQLDMYGFSDILLREGFKLNLGRTVPAWHNVKIDTRDRDSMKHCVVERWDRASGEQSPELSVRAMQRKITDSIEMCLCLQEKGIDIIQPYYMIKNARIGWLIPIYLEDDFDLSRPSAAMAVSISPENGNGSMLTLLSVEMAHLNILTLNPNACCVWVNKGCGMAK